MRMQLAMRRYTIVTMQKNMERKARPCKLRLIADEVDNILMVLCTNLLPQPLQSFTVRLGKGM